MDSKHKTSYVFLDGKIIPEEDAKVSIKTHALHYGTGCFEGIRAYYNEKENALFVFRLKDHYKRFFESCKILFINLPLDIDGLCKTTEEILKKNFDKTDIYIRPLAFKSDNAVGKFNLKTLKDSLAIYTVPLGRYLNTQGVKANISSWKRIPDNAIPPRGKITGSYVNTALAKTESLLNGYDEAIFLDSDGHVAEGSAENIFMVKDGKLYTPPVNSDILCGITRDTVIKLCKNDLNLEVEQRGIDRSEIYQADEVFLVGTGAEVSPVIEVDKRPIGDGKIGPISLRLKDTYHKLVHGEYPKYKEYLTKITE